MQVPIIQSDYGKLSASVTVQKPMDCFTTLPLCSEKFSSAHSSQKEIWQSSMVWPLLLHRFCFFLVVCGG